MADDEDPIQGFSGSDAESGGPAASGRVSSCHDVEAIYTVISPNAVKAGFLPALPAKKGGKTPEILMKNQRMWQAAHLLKGSMSFGKVAVTKVFQRILDENMEDWPRILNDTEMAEFMKEMPKRFRQQCRYIAQVQLKKKGGWIDNLLRGEPDMAEPAATTDSGTEAAAKAAPTDSGTEAAAKVPPERQQRQKPSASAVIEVPETETQQEQKPSAGAAASSFAVVRRRFFGKMSETPPAYYEGFNWEAKTAWRRLVDGDSCTEIAELSKLSSKTDANDDDFAQVEWKDGSVSTLKEVTVADLRQMNAVALTTVKGPTWTGNHSSDNSVIRVRKKDRGAAFTVSRNMLAKDDDWVERQVCQILTKNFGDVLDDKAQQAANAFAVRLATDWAAEKFADITAEKNKRLLQIGSSPNGPSVAPMVIGKAVLKRPASHSSGRDKKQQKSSETPAKEVSCSDSPEVSTAKAASSGKSMKAKPSKPVKVSSSSDGSSSDSSKSSASSKAASKASSKSSGPPARSAWEDCRVVGSTPFGS